MEILPQTISHQKYTEKERFTRAHAQRVRIRTRFGGSKITRKHKCSTGREKVTADRGESMSLSVGMTNISARPLPFVMAAYLGPFRTSFVGTAARQRNHSEH